MCGLYGAAGPNLSHKDQEAVKYLGVLTKVRGRDSSGLFTCYRPPTMKNGGFKVKMHKTLQESPAFLASKTVERMLEDNPFVIGGHTRLATHGSVKLSNAHPLSVGHFIGMHNGVMDSLYDRVNDKTDTEVLFQKMMTAGLADGIKIGLKAGSMALVFINKSNGSLNYYRDTGRPLFIGIEEKKKKFFWSSQKDFLEFLHKNNLVRFNQIYSVSPYILHSISLKNMAMTMTEINNNDWIDRDYPYTQYNDNNTTVTQVGRKPTTLLRPTEKTDGVAIALGCYSREIRPVVKVSSAVSSLPALLDNKKSLPGQKTFFRGFANELWDVAAAAQVILGKNCCCEVCGGRPGGLSKKVKWVSKKAWLCNGWGHDCANDERILEMCYDGVPLYDGMLVDKNNRPINPAHNEDEAPF